MIPINLVFQFRFSDKFSSQQTHCQTLESSLKAARREADAIREQLQLHEQRNSTTSTALTTATTSAAAVTTSAAAVTRNSAHPVLDFNLDSAWATLLTQVKIKKR